MVNKLTGIINNEKSKFLVFKKDQTLIKLFKKIILEIDDSYSILLQSFEDFIYINSIEDVEEKDLIEKVVSTIEDEYFDFKGDDYALNIIFGSKKVFFSFSSKKMMGEKIMSIIRKECEFNEHGLLEK